MNLMIFLRRRSQGEFGDDRPLGSDLFEQVTVFRRINNIQTSAQNGNSDSAGF